MLAMQGEGKDSYMGSPHLHVCSMILASATILANLGQVCT